MWIPRTRLCLFKYKMPYLGLLTFILSMMLFFRKFKLKRKARKQKKYCYFISVCILLLICYIGVLNTILYYIIDIGFDTQTKSQGFFIVPFAGGFLFLFIFFNLFFGCYVKKLSCGSNISATIALPLLLI
jgi:hypothetical protein